MTSGDVYSALFFMALFVVVWITAIVIVIRSLSSGYRSVRFSGALICAVGQTGLVIYAMTHF